MSGRPVSSAGTGSPRRRRPRSRRVGEVGAEARAPERRSPREQAQAAEVDPAVPQPSCRNTYGLGAPIDVVMRTESADRPSRSIARSHNQGMGGVEAAGQPELHLRIVQRAAAAPDRRPGCCYPRGNPVAAVRDPLARTETARPRGATRCRRPADQAQTPLAGTSPRLSHGVGGCHRRCPFAAARSAAGPDRRRRSSAAHPWVERSDWTRYTRFSQIMVWPSQARSVDDSPSPAAA